MRNLSWSLLFVICRAHNEINTKCAMHAIHALTKYSISALLAHSLQKKNHMYFDPWAMLSDALMHRQYVLPINIDVPADYV